MFVDNIFMGICIRNYLNMMINGELNVNLFNFDGVYFNDCGIFQIVVSIKIFVYDLFGV